MIFHNGGPRASPAHGLRITIRYRDAIRFQTAFGSRIAPSRFRATASLHFASKLLQDATVSLPEASKVLCSEQT